MNSFRISHRPRRGPQGASSRALAETGFTIIEILVSVAVLGVIAVPMAMAFSASFRVSAATSARLGTAADRDRLAFRFTTDVASVDATGVTRSSATACNSVGGGGVLFVTLNSTTKVTPQALTNRVSYWVTGAGTDIKIVRRSCPDARPGQPATTLQPKDSQVLADEVGYPGATASSIVHGPFEFGGAPCDEYRCQIEIDKRDKDSNLDSVERYRVVALRRVFGSGIPLEVGKIYSSSFRQYGSPPYEHFTDTGTSKSKELRFSNQLTLPGGLDGPPLLTVSFKVQQDTGGKWLSCPDASQGRYDNCVWVDSGEGVWNVGSYDPSTTVWSLPLRLGSNEVMKFGGLYKISTELRTSPTSTKVYGGTNGFPLWVDFNPDDVIFVAKDATGSGLRYDDPIGSIDLALRAAKVHRKPEILLANGEYLESVAISNTADYADNRTLVGGHDPVTWLRGPSGINYRTKISGTNGVGLRIDGKKVQRLRQLSFSSGAPVVNNVSGQAGSSTFGLIASNGASVFVEYSRLRAEPGGLGGRGADGTTFGDACWGQEGKTEQAPGSSTGRRDQWRAAPSRNGVAGASCTVNGTRVAGYGGGGGGIDYDWLGVPYGQSGGQGGQGGTSSLPGGAGGANDTCSPKRGRPGPGGTQSAAQSSGGGPGSPNYQLPQLGYAGTPGTPGVAGADGVGGAGAGGGAGTGCITEWGNPKEGASGGGGGQGGIGGGAGAGGYPGGASVGILADGSSTRVKLDYSQPVSAGGGSGGAGGNGGAGSYGGAGGDAALNTYTAEFSLSGSNGSAAGGSGGSAGNGGGGGGGGEGGLSANLLIQGGAQYAQNGVDWITPPRGRGGAGGSGGAGGLGGPGGNGGQGSGAFLWLFPINQFVEAGRPGAGSSAGLSGAAGRDNPIFCHLVFREPNSAPSCAAP